MRKKILLVHTGGTISMSSEGKKGVTISDKNPLVEKTNELNTNCAFVVKEPFHLPSPHITIKEMFTLKQTIEECRSNEHIDGVVITHGTDTLEETAYFLHLTVKTDIPVIITGAMRSVDEIGYDGLHNLLSAISVASSTKAKEKGVLVVFNEEIHSAKYVTKTHTSNVATFQSPQTGPIGTVTKKGVHFYFDPAVKEHFEVERKLNKNVILLKAYAGMDSSLFHAALQRNCDGIVIETLGQGNLPPATLDGIKALIEKNIPIVAVSRCFNGSIHETYGYDGGGKMLKEMGLIFANGLNGQKARIKLLIALSITDDRKKIEAMFQNE